jgi:hypothetical protein
LRRRLAEADCERRSGVGQRGPIELKGELSEDAAADESLLDCVVPDLAANYTAARQVPVVISPVLASGKPRNLLIRQLLVSALCKGHQTPKISSASIGTFPVFAVTASR